MIIYVYICHIICCGGHQIVLKLDSWSVIPCGTRQFIWSFCFWSQVSFWGYRLGMGMARGWGGSLLLALLALTHILDSTVEDLHFHFARILEATLMMGGAGMRTGWGWAGMLTFIGTCTDAWCYHQMLSTWCLWEVAGNPAITLEEQTQCFSMCFGQEKNNWSITQKNKQFHTRFQD